MGCVENLSINIQCERVFKGLMSSTGDVNGDGRADAVCAGDDGSVRVWEACYIE